jgi:hypothetical protein
MSHKSTYRLIALLAIVAILLTGCGGGKKSVKDQIVGTWNCTDPTLTGDAAQTVTFEFKKDLSASLSMTGVTVAATYKWLTDTQIELDITMGTQSQTQNLDVSVTDSKLSLTAEGQTIECTKK